MTGQNTNKDKDNNKFKNQKSKCKMTIQNQKIINFLLENF